MSSDLLPTLALYPKLVTIQRTLRGSLYILPYKDLPYRITAPGNPKVVFYEFRGKGPPPGDIGRPRDVYGDVTFPYSIYCVGTGGWEAWNPQAADGSQLLARNRYLWTSCHHHGFSWLAKESLAKSYVNANEPQSINQDKLKHFLHFSPSTMTASLALNVADSQARNDAEITRRRLNGVAIDVEAKPNQGHAPKVECSDSLIVAFLQSELQERDKKLERLKGDNLFLKASLDAGKCSRANVLASLSEGDQRNGGFSFLPGADTQILVEGKLQNSKRKHEEDSQAASRERAAPG
ncbi:hypothetical protein DFH06DRAFT_1123844 [Mycena polygramma]|nr:hypothetical protein DFH06DRAFT_1123844 [Mycena polygramma]